LQALVGIRVAHCDLSTMSQNAASAKDLEDQLRGMILSNVTIASMTAAVAVASIEDLDHIPAAVMLLTTTPGAHLLTG
jgi:hypothetical protein